MKASTFGIFGLCLDETCDRHVQSVACAPCPRNPKNRPSDASEALRHPFLRLRWVGSQPVEWPISLNNASRSVIGFTCFTPWNAKSYSSMVKWTWKVPLLWQLSPQSLHWKNGGSGLIHPTHVTWLQRRLVQYSIPVQCLALLCGHTRFTVPASGGTVVLVQEMLQPIFFGNQTWQWISH